MKTAELQEYMVRRKADFSLFFNFDHFNPNMFYFSGYSSLGCLVVPKRGRKFLIVPAMDEEVARKTGSRVVVYRKDFYAALKKAVKTARTIGVEKAGLSVMQYNKLKRKIRVGLVDIGPACQKLRAIKTSSEILKIKQSCRLAEQIMGKCAANFNFKTEEEVAAFLECEAKKAGAETAFPAIVASGKNASMPHYRPVRHKLGKGFLIIDFGVKLNGYCSDITRTFYIGKPGNEEAEVYKTVLECQGAMISAIKPGMKCADLAAVGEKALGSYKKNMIHSFGHGLGVEVHESPSISPLSRETLAEGNVISIEPGIYLPNKFGIRVEGVVAVTKSGAQLLTKMPRQLTKIKQKVY